MHVILAVIWFAGGIIRVYLYARFFQIEEYQNVRFLRWLVGNPDRLAWRRPIGVVIPAILVSLIVGPRSEVWVLLVLGAAALGAVWPTRSREVKKKFVRTQRALRLLVASILAFSVLTMLGITAVERLFDSMTVYLATTIMGGLLFLTGPVFLVIGNVLVAPVEAGMRQIYLLQARSVLRQLEPTVIGITGSYGKTSTKHFLNHILNGRYRSIATPKSYNTLMGVTLAINTVLKDESDVDYFIVEMGAYIEGEIAEICNLAQPQISIVTAVGPQHLERFGSLEAVTNAKFEIVAALPPDGIAVLNADNARVKSMASRAHAAKTILVSREGSEGAGLLAQNIVETLDGLSFDVVEVETGAERHFHAPVYGIHNVTNLLLATAVARHIGLSLGEIAMRVAGLEPFEHRLQRKIQPGGLVVLDDAYSANPEGAKSALHVLGLHNEGKRILITPGMVELGELHEQENRKLGELATQYATDIILVGIEQTRPIYRGVVATSFDQNHLHVFDTHLEAVGWLRENARAGDTVLFLNDLPDTYL